MTGFRKLSILVFATLSLAHAGNAFAIGGEDFPFFCRMDNERQETAFIVRPDPKSETGYTLKLFRRWRLAARIPVEIRATDGGRYWVISGRARQKLNLLYDDRVLAYVASTSGFKSHGGVEVEWHRVDTEEWDLAPMTCGHEVRHARP